jgi:phosphate transport system substrate-binding protein
MEKRASIFLSRLNFIETSQPVHHLYAVDSYSQSGTLFQIDSICFVDSLFPKSRKTRYLPQFHTWELSVENKDEPANRPPVPTTPLSGTTQPSKGGSPGVRIAIFGAIGVVLALLIYFSPQFLIKAEKPSSYTPLKLGGTSVIATIAENRWKTAYRKEKGIEIEYESTGSTGGVTNLIDGSFAIAFTHAPLTDEQKKKAEAKGPILHIPVILCGVAPVYNVMEFKGKPPVKFTGEVLADIFLGKITRWDDKALRDLNPELMPLPSTEIKVVHREDSSGTTYLFSEFLNATSKSWREKYQHPSSEIQWPVGVGAKRNLGVATKVYQTEGAIGYVDRMCTSFDDMVLDYGAVKNENKEKPTFVLAEPEKLVAALQGAFPEIRDDLTFTLADKPGSEAYPISGVVYAICYQNQPETQRHKVSEFLHWITHEGQAAVKRSTYAPLPSELVSRVDRRLNLIKGTP